MIAISSRRGQSVTTTGPETGYITNYYIRTDGDILAAGHSC